MPSVHNLTISDTEFGIDESRVHPCRNPKGQKVPAGLVLDKEKFRLGQSVILLTPNGKYFATAAMDRTWKLWGSDDGKPLF